MDRFFFQCQSKHPVRPIYFLWPLFCHHFHDWIHRCCSWLQGFVSITNILLMQKKILLEKLRIKVKSESPPPPDCCFLKGNDVLRCWVHTACYWCRAADGDKAQGTLSITFVCSKSSNELSLPLIRLFPNAWLLIISQHYGHHYLQSKFISFSQQLFKKK